MLNNFPGGISVFLTLNHGICFSPVLPECIFQGLGTVSKKTYPVQVFPNIFGEGEGGSERAIHITYQSYPYHLSGWKRTGSVKL